MQDVAGRKRLLVGECKRTCEDLRVSSRQREATRDAALAAAMSSSTLRPEFSNDLTKSSSRLQ